MQVPLDILISFPLYKHPEAGLLGPSSMFDFSEEPPPCFPQQLHQFTFPPPRTSAGFSSHPRQLLLSRLFEVRRFNGREATSRRGFNLHFSDD